jgi:hypothetical protein
MFIPDPDLDFLPSPDPGSGGSKRQLIPDPVPQHCIHFYTVSLRTFVIPFIPDRKKLFVRELVDKCFAYSLGSVKMGAE